MTKLMPYFFISLLLFYPLINFVYLNYYKSIPYDPINSPFFQDKTAIVLFLISIFNLILNFVLDKKWYVLIVLILISWCASISWGYQTPVLFSTPLLYCFFVLSQKLWTLNKINNLIVYTLFVGTVTYFIAYQKPYCNPKRSNLIYINIENN